MIPPLRFGLRLVRLAELTIGRHTNLQRSPQGQKSRMPLRDAIIRQPLIAAVIALVIEKALLQIGRLGIGMNIAQRI
jgi:hypothetical protein